MTERELLRRAAELAADHLDTLDTRPVYPRVSVDELTARIDVPLPDGPTDPAAVVEELAAALEPGVVASQSGRYFGFVVGSSLPAALAADVLVSAWDQNLGLLALGPSALVAENTAGAWVKDLLGIPASASFAFVTGCQTAHFTCLAAARQHVLVAVGWDVDRAGPLPAHRLSPSSSARSATRRSIARCATSASAGGRSTRSMRCRTAGFDPAGAPRARSPAPMGRRSSAPRRAR